MKIFRILSLFFIAISTLLALGYTYKAHASEIGQQLASPTYLKAPLCPPANQSYTRITWGNSDASDASYIVETANDPEFTVNLWPIGPITWRYYDLSFGSSPQQRYLRVKAVKSGYLDSDWRVADNPLTIGYPSVCQQNYVLLSKNDLGELPNGAINGDFAIGDNGRFVTFVSAASNLDPTDTNGTTDVFMIDRNFDSIKRVSKNTGINSNYHSTSRDGNFVAFSSMVYDQFVGYNVNHIFLYDRGNDTTTDIIKSFNVNCGYTPSSYYTSLSETGRYLVFGSSCNSLTPGDTGGFDLFLNDRESGSLTKIAPGTSPSITPDGRYVAFESNATNLIPGKTIYGEQIYVYDTSDNSITLMSIANDGQPATGTKSDITISDNGRFVAFAAIRAANLVPRSINETNNYVFLHDRDRDEDGIYDEENEPGATETKMVSVQFTQDFMPRINANGTLLSMAHLFMQDPTYVKIVEIDRLLNDPTYSTWGEKITNGNSSDHASIITPDDKEIIFLSWSSNLANPMPQISTGQLYSKPLTNDKDGDGFVFFEDCNDNYFNINPGLYETPYNNIDENCNGMNDEDDIDSDGYDLSTDCNDSNPGINPNAIEISYNSIDENCNGMADDDDLDFDGYGIDSDCDESNPTINPGTVEIPYNGIDENCNGMTDDTDYDGDGYDYAVDCDDYNPAINPGSIETPYNGIDENCNGMADDDDLDQDGYGVAADCNDLNPAVHPNSTEIPYNGIDENCNGMADDDDLDHDGHGILEDCNDNDPTIYLGAPEIKHDGIDQNCNGYDLTIDVTATYKANKDRLTVEATTSLGSAASLELDGYGPMTYSGNKWSIIVEPASGNPGTVTVTGIEGSDTATVQ